MKYFGERERNYYIQSNNRHLLNILEDNYYMELGVINLKIIDQLLKHQPLEISDLVYFDILNTGVGKITNDPTTDIYYQLNYLLSLRQKSSTSKFFLTCGTLRYFDEEGREKYAPIVLIPIEINYQQREIVCSGEPTPNRLLLKLVSKRIKETIDDQNRYYEAISNVRLLNIAAIDRYCQDLGTNANLIFEPSNYLTACKVEYHDFNIDPDFFTVERSIFETSSKKIINDYFKEVHGILPTNIHQKYAVLKASRGENFIVDGRLGSGKTYTILNIIADSIRKEKTVLYLNQDLDGIWDVEKNLRYIGLDNYFINLTTNLQDIRINSVVLPKINGQIRLDECIEKIEQFEEGLQERFYGFTYSDMIENLVILNQKLAVKENLKIEPTLEKYEVNMIYNSLKQVEKTLEKIDPLPDNIWRKLYASNENITSMEIVERTKLLFEVQTQINEAVFSYCQKYRLKVPTNIHDLYRLVSHVIAFSSNKPLSVWKNPDIIVMAGAALTTIQNLSDIRFVCMKYYSDYITKTYIPGRMALIYLELCGSYLDPDAKNSDIEIYINRMLSSDKRMIEIDALIESSIKIYNKLTPHIEKHFNLKDIQTTDMEYLKKVLEYLEHDNTNKELLKIYADNPEIFETISNQINDNYLEMKRIKDGYIEYLQNDKALDTAELLANDGPGLEDYIRKQFDRNLIKKKRQNINNLTNEVINYYQIAQKIIRDIAATDYKMLHNSYETFWSTVSDLNSFIDRLTDYEKEKFHVFLVEYNRMKKSDEAFLVKSLKEYINCFNNVILSCSNLKNYHILIFNDSFAKRIMEIRKASGFLKKVDTLKREIHQIFHKKQKTVYHDIMELINIDEKYINVEKEMAQNELKYKMLLGQHFQSYDTVINEIGQLVEHFSDFALRLEKKDDVDALLSPKSFAGLTKEILPIRDLYSLWVSRFRQFSLCFRGGQPTLQENGFEKNYDIITQFVDKCDQIKHVMTVNKELMEYQSIGLSDLANGIQTCRYQKEVADQFYYAVLLKMKKQIDEIRPYLNNFAVIQDYYNTFESYERDYCTANIGYLKSEMESIRKSNRLDNIKFTDYNRIIDSSDRNTYLYLADLNIFNSQLDLQLFDLVIIDDGQLSTANKYNRINECKQVIVFGDRQAKSSVVNTLMQRISEKNIFNFRNRYVQMNSQFNNMWTTNNRYIYGFDTMVIYDKIDSIAEFSKMIVDYFADNINHTINVIIGDEQTRREVYSYIVEFFRTKYSSQEIIQILCYNIRLINAHNESSRYAHDVFIYYNDFLYCEDSIKDILFKNFVIVTTSIQIYYLRHKTESKNVEVAKEIENILGPERQWTARITPLGTLIKQHLKKQGVSSEYGFGRFNLVIKGEKTSAIPNIGIIIIGEIDSDNYSILDDYLYYYTDYTRRGWKIEIVYVEELINHFSEFIGRVVKQIKGGRRRGK